MSQSLPTRRSRSTIPGLRNVTLRAKITLAVSLIVLTILSVGALLIWDKLGTWELQRSYLLLGMWTMGGVAFSVYFAIRYLTQPLSDLTSMAQQLGEGRLDRRMHIESDGEIGQLSLAFDNMADSLQAAQETLEQKVAERTEALEHSQQQLLQAAKLASIGELAGGVAHEINNPASIMLMRIAQLEEELGALNVSEEATEDVAVIGRQVEKISRIVSGLLTFSRRSTTELRPLDVNDVVRRTVHLMEDLVKSRGIELELDLAGALPRTRGDSSQIEQVLLNLVNNALDAMPRGGRITFITRVSGGDENRGPAVKLSVVDTGTGIAPEHLDRIFDPFFTTKEPGEGTGLGLSVSYGIAEQHGGVLEASSAPDVGTRFDLRLPVDEAVPSPPSEETETLNA